VRILTVLLLGVALLAGIAQAIAVSPATAQARGGTIRNIIVEGTRRIDPQSVAGYLTIKRGEPFDSAKIDASLKSLFASGLFRDVSIRRRGRDLVVRVVESPIVNRVAFEGNSKLDNEDLNAAANISPRSVYSRARVEEAIRNMLVAYRAAGRYAAAITPKVIARSQNRVDVVFEIEEGAKTLVRRITFIGNRNYSDGSLRDAIVTKETAFWRFLGRSDIYDPGKLEADKELLRRYYLERGFAEFQVLSAVAELAPDREGFFITITVSEGPRYRFGKLVVDSRLPRIESKELTAAVKAQTGDRYNAGKIDRSVVALTNVAGTHGYAFARVNPRVKLNRDKATADVTFTIDRGQRIFIERIEILGNVRTRDSVVRREILVSEGDAFNTTKISQSRRRLVNTGYFESVNIERREGTTPDRVRLVIVVVERATGQLSLGGGFSTRDGPLGNIGIQESNFLGRGYDVRLSGQLSLRASQIDASFTDKHFLGRDVSFGVDLFRTKRGFQSNFSESSDFQIERLGGRVRFGYPLAENVRQGAFYELTNRRVTDVAEERSQFLRNDTGTSTKSAVGTNIVWDTRDNRFEATDGFVLGGGTTIAGLGGSESFYKFTAEAGYWQSLTPGLVLALLGEAGHVGGIGQDVKLGERFFLGGDRLRGFEYGGVGPRDRATNDSLGGNNYWLLTAELSFPLGLPKELGIKGRVFTDTGSAFGIDASGSNLIDNGSPRISAGAGLSWRSPLGPLRFDFGFPLARQPHDRARLFNFRFGTRF